MAPAYVLPVETFEAIIDRASDDTCSLRNLSLTCHAFLPIVRYHLFDTIVLQSVQQVESLSEFLDTHKWACPLVRKLAHSSCLIPSSDSNSMVHVLDAVPIHLLSQLPNLHTWKTGTTRSDGAEMGAWLQSGHRPGGSISPGYSHHVRSLELAYVPFKTMLDFVELVAAFTGIHTLTCSHIWIKSGTDTPGHQVSAQGPGVDVRRRSVPFKSLQVSSMAL